MTELESLLVDRVASRGAAALSVIARPGGNPTTVWTPGSAEEPGFLAYSITKPFLAVVMLRLAEEGKLSLDDKLARWESTAPRAAEISLRQLLNHTAGLSDYGALPGYHNAVKRSPSTPWTFETFAGETYEKQMRFPPGQGWGYSNPGYMLIKRVAEKASGSSFRSLVAESIAIPLGLPRTFVAESIEDLKSLAPAMSRYLSVDGSPLDTRAHYHPGWVSHGVIASTASEVARFFDALFDGRVLSRESLAEMLELVPIEPGDHFCYGLGLMADLEGPGGLTVGHNGGGPGYIASAYHFMGSKTTVCVMAAVEDGLDGEAFVREVFSSIRAQPSRTS